MDVILKQDVDNLGDAGDIVTVADGYANNFLVPRGLAMRATRGAVADAEAIRRARIKREAKQAAEAEEVRASLEARPVVITAKAGEDGTLYGSVGNREIAEGITRLTGVTVDRRKLPLERPLKEVGRHEVAVKLHRDVTATVTVDIVAEEA